MLDLVSSVKRLRAFVCITQPVSLTLQGGQDIVKPQREHPKVIPGSFTSKAFFLLLHSYLHLSLVGIMYCGQEVACTHIHHLNAARQPYITR